MKKKTNRLKKDIKLDVSFRMTTREKLEAFDRIMQSRGWQKGNALQ